MTFSPDVDPFLPKYVRPFLLLWPFPPRSFIERAGTGILLLKDRPGAMRSEYRQLHLLIVSFAVFLPNYFQMPDLIVVPC